MKPMLGQVLALCCLLILSSQVDATDKKPPPKKEPQTNSTATSSSRSESDAHASASNRSTSSATGGDASATGGDATATTGDSSASSSNEGNSLTVQETHPDHITFKNVPNVYAPDAYPSSPCRISGSFGGSVVGGGLSFGGSKLDEECDKRETARAFALLGQGEAALRILCTTKAARETLAGDCAALTVKKETCDMTPQASSSTGEAKTECVTRKDLEETVDRVVRKTSGK